MSAEKRELSLEELDQVSGGIEEIDDPQANKRCPNCTTLMKKVSGGFKCPDCGETYTNEQLKVVSGGVGKALNQRTSLFRGKVFKA